jgi:hypothetical protein
MGFFPCLPIFAVSLWLFLCIRSNSYATKIFKKIFYIEDILCEAVVQSLRSSELGILGMPPTFDIWDLLV